MYDCTRNCSGNSDHFRFSTGSDIITHQAFAQPSGKATTELTINMSPDIVGESSYHVTGKLTFKAEPATFVGEAFPRSYGLGGATITFKTGEGDTILSPTQTKADGSYSVTGSIIPFQVPALARPIQVDNVIA